LARDPLLPPSGSVAATLSALCAVVLLTGLAGCGTVEPAGAPISWEQRLAVGRLQQALDQLERGDRAGARRTAELALAEASRAAHLPTMANAKALLAALEGNVVRLQEALAQLEQLGDEVGLARARLMLAELAVSADRPDIAVPALQAAVAALPDDPRGRIESAATEARVYHLQAAALRLAGRAQEAAASERRAALALSVLPDAELLRLRAEIAQACGDDLYREFDARGALAQHARAAACAREAGERATELHALAALAADFELDGRWREAADHSERALRLAHELGETAVARAVAQRGLVALRVLREPETSARWRAFEEALPGD